MIRSRVGKTREIVLVGLVGLAVLAGAGGCARDDAAPLDRRPVPPIDLEAPQVLETATFAMG